MTQPLKAQEPPIEEILASIRRMIAHDNAGKPTSTATELAKPASAISSADRLAHGAGLAPTGTAGAPAHPRAAAPAPDESDRRFGRRMIPPGSPPPSPSPVPPASPAASASSADLAGGASALAAAAPLRSAIRGSDIPADAVAAAERAAEMMSREFASPAAAAPSPPREAEQAYDRSETAEAAPPAGRPFAPSHVSPTTEATVGAAFAALAQATAPPTPRTLEEVVHDALQPMLKAWLDDNLPQLVERLVRAEIERIVRGR